MEVVERGVEGLPAEVQQRAEESMKMWSLRYGCANELTDHTDLIIFGLIPINALCAEGLVWAWLAPEARSLSHAEKRRALRKWRRLLPSWTLAAVCPASSRPHKHFLTFLGFRPTTVVEGEAYFTRLAHGN